MGKQSRERREKWAKVQEARDIEGLVKRARIFDIARASSKTMRQGFNGKDFVVIDATDVSRYCQEEFSKIPKGYEPYFGGWKDKFNLALPYDHMVIEWRGDGKHQDDKLIVVEKADNTEETTTFHFTPYTLACTLSDKKWYESLSYEDRMFIGVSRDDIDLMPFEKWDVDTVTFDARGRITSSSVDDDDRYPYDSVTVLLTLTFLVCQNITLEDQSPDTADSLDYQRHFGVPLTKYKTLGIKPIGKRANSDQPQQAFDVMPLHLRRGNFAHYTDDAPLFGKYTGTFWRPATVVGSEKNGVVVKDYKVIAEVERETTIQALETQNGVAK